MPQPATLVPTKPLPNKHIGLKNLRKSATTRLLGKAPGDESVNPTEEAKKALEREKNKKLNAKNSPYGTRPAGFASPGNVVRPVMATTRKGK